MITKEDFLQGIIDETEENHLEEKEKEEIELLHEFYEEGRITQIDNSDI